LRRYDAGMDPTVTGALIAGGAALIGFGASALTNRATLRANRRMATDQRLWEKRAAIYEALAAYADSLLASDEHGWPIFAQHADLAADVHKLFTGEHSIPLRLYGSERIFKAYRSFDDVLTVALELSQDPAPSYRLDLMYKLDSEVGRLMGLIRAEAQDNRYRPNRRGYRLYVMADRMIWRKMRRKNFS
jgi:hypothetical protein